MEGRVVIWIHGGIRRKDPIYFRYEGEEFLHILSGKALEGYYAKRGQKLDLITFVPHSLYIDHMQKEKQAMEKDLENFREIPLPSIGTIRKENKEYFFGGSYKYIKFWIFLKLLEIYMEGKYKTFYCDISQGLNIYTDAFKEAFRSLLLFDRLKNMGSTGIKVIILYSDPILNGVENPRLYTNVELNVKVWFDTPIGRPVENFASKHLLDAQTRKLLKNYYRTYRAIRYNVPGVVFTFGYDSKERIQEITQELLKKYLTEYHPGEFQEGKASYTYPLPEEPEEKINLFLALALYYNMARMLEDKGIQQKKEFTLEELGKFSEVYEHYGLCVNREMLGRDIERLKTHEKDIERFERLPASLEWKLLGELLNESFRPRKREDLIEDPNIRRNFFAHSGLENNSVCVSKAEGGRLVLKYKETLRNLIDRFVYEEGISCES